MKKKILPYVLAVLLVCCGAAFSKVSASGIAVKLLSYQLDSTLNVNLGYTLTISAEVQNIDTQQSFSGLLDFGLRNNQQTLSQTGIFNKPPYSTNIITLGPGEIVPAVFSIDIDQPYFSTGPDVVVVWPISNSPIADSIRILLNILDPSGIAGEKELNVSYLIMPDRIMLLNTMPQTTLKQVRIYSIVGQQLSFIQSASLNEIPLPEMPHGIYLCEMTGTDNKRKVIRFFH
ncbi:MAG: T9SS type A sorting domain-containing protein [Chitinophagales bacterium]